jgi:hypothetical protein
MTRFTPSKIDEVLASVLTPNGVFAIEYQIGGDGTKRWRAFYKTAKPPATSADYFHVDGETPSEAYRAALAQLVAISLTS